MRLKEPLYGIRVAQMHALIHLCLVINMAMLKFNVFDYDRFITEDGKLDKKEFLRKESHQNCDDRQVDDAQNDQDVVF